MPTDNESSGAPADGPAEYSADESAEDLLESGRPLPRWVQVVAGALAVLVIGYLAIHALHGSSHQPLAAPAPSGSHSPETAPPLFRSPGGPRMTGTVGCGPQLAPVQVQAADSTGGLHTGLQLLVGGGELQRVDFDSGHSRRLQHLPRLHPDEWFDSIIAAAGTSYATTSGVPCEMLTSRVLAVHGDRTSLVSAAPASGVVSDGSQTWAVLDPPHVLSPLPRGHDVQLPTGFSPVAATGGQIVGNLVEAMDPNEIAAVDARTGQVRNTPGESGTIVAAGHGRVFWTAGCAVDARHRCTLHSAAATGGAPRTYALPTSPSGSPGVVSPDGRYLALVVAHVVADVDPKPRSPMLDGDVAVLDLHTGTLRVVPGVALPSRYAPSFSFAPHGWLVMAYETAGAEHLIAWRAGLRAPVSSPFGHANSPAAPPVAVLPG